MSINSLLKTHASIAELVRLFLEDKKEVYSPKTIKTYTHHLREFVYSLEKVSATELSQRDIDNYIANLKSKKLTDSTISNHLYALKEFLRFCNLSYSLDFRHSTYRKNLILKSNLITKYDYNLILNSIYKKSLSSENEFCYAIALRDFIIAQLLIETGAKTNELINLKIQDVDFKKKIIHIKEVNRPERKILIKPETIYLIELFLENKKILHSTKPESYLFVSFDKKNGLGGFQITTRTVQRTITEHSNGRYRPKDFRHTFVMIQLLSNAGLYTTADLLGGISDDTKTYYRNLVNRYGGKIEMHAEDYNAYEYLRHKYGKVKLNKFLQNNFQ